MTYHFYFKNSEPVCETEYMQSLKQFAVQEVFPAYVLKFDFITFRVHNCSTCMVDIDVS